MSNSPGLVDFAFGLVIFVLTKNVICPTGKCCFLGKFKLQKGYNQSCQSKRVLGLIEMTCGLVHASYSLHEWQSVILTFFPPCQLSILITIILITTTLLITGDIQKKLRVFKYSLFDFYAPFPFGLQNIVQKIYMLRAKISA